MTGETWDVLFDRFDPDDERRREALLALGNGALLTRTASTSAGFEGHGYPGTYRAGLYDRRDDEAAGERVAHDVLVNLPDWLPLAVRVQGEEGWLSTATAEVLQYRHGLDTRRGLSCRDMLLRDKKGRRVWLRERRLVSMAQPRLAALRLEVELLDWEGTLEIRSALDGAVRNANWPQEMPGSRRMLAPCQAAKEGPALLLQTRLLRSGLAVALAACTEVVSGEITGRRAAMQDDGVAELIACRAAKRVIRVEKVTALCTARDPASFEPGETALRAVRDAPDFTALLSEHEAAWERLWSAAACIAARRRWGAPSGCTPSYCRQHATTRPSWMPGERRDDAARHREVVGCASVPCRLRKIGVASAWRPAVSGLASQPCGCGVGRRARRDGRNRYVWGAVLPRLTARRRC